MPLCHLCEILKFPSLHQEIYYKPRFGQVREREKVSNSSSLQSICEEGKEPSPLNTRLPESQYEIFSRNDASALNNDGYFDEDGSGSLVANEEIDTEKTNLDVYHYRRNFGHVSEILSRKVHCTFCALVSQRLETQDVEAGDFCEIVTPLYCSSRGSDRRYIFSVEISLTPAISDGFSGPYLPEQQASASLKQSRCILALQKYVEPTFDDATGVSNNTADFSGRRMNPEHADLNLFANWIHRCRTSHSGKCSKSVVPDSVPQTLKELQVIDVQKMCIIDAPQACRYVALSYCWGTAVTLRHLLANSERLRTPGALAIATLPATIADAISLVRGVGETYLWVDALCIVQDDPISQQIQLAQMGLVYSLAHFTIVAAAGKDANAGLPGVRPRTRKITQEVVQLGGQNLITTISGQYYGGVSTSHWLTRAWTMQEKALSKKALVFTNEQVYWSCWGALWLEETALENIPGWTRFHRNPLSKDWSKVSFTTVENGYYSLCDDLVESYLHRQLSFQSDILNAFSGITQVLGFIRNDAFYWGLPESRFDRYLGWKMYGGSRRNDALCAVNGRQTRFPSWSWTAWFGGGQSFIGWSGQTQRLQGEPEILFYRRESNGVLVAITDRTSKKNEAPAQAQKWLEESGHLELRTKWKGYPRSIAENEINPSLDNGHIYFWTSTAKVYIHRTRLHAPSGPRYSILWDTHIKESLTEIHLESSSHLPFRDPETMKNLPKYVLKRIEADGNVTSDVLVKDVAVVGRGSWTAGPKPSSCSTSIVALVIEWEGDVAYRIGVCSVKEDVWVSLTNRVWKRVVLR
ncbi:hypothetical protein G7Y89_g1982 [Cudoniella acicularis]|uniref:Heterokaryon incompatibility domain-containing protein n=1 Tax=Cudoniella acicularis TaxID=354080 RepID=A0A8H4RU80_9HELO|nr:hypothetical protein G7Y89_g1982 [Cudoniella acicularis]